MKEKVFVLLCAQSCEPTEVYGVYKTKKDAVKAINEWGKEENIDFEKDRDYYLWKNGYLAISKEDVVE